MFFQMLKTAKYRRDVVKVRTNVLDDIGWCIREHVLMIDDKIIIKAHN